MLDGVSVWDMWFVSRIVVEIDYIFLYSKCKLQCDGIGQLYSILEYRMRRISPRCPVVKWLESERWWLLKVVRFSTSENEQSCRFSWEEALHTSLRIARLQKLVLAQLLLESSYFRTAVIVCCTSCVCRAWTQCNKTVRDITNVIRDLNIKPACMVIITHSYISQTQLAVWIKRGSEPHGSHTTFWLLKHISSCGHISHVKHPSGATVCCLRVFFSVWNWRCWLAARWITKFGLPYSDDKCMDFGYVIEAKSKSSSILISCREIVPKYVTEKTIRRWRHRRGKFWNVIVFFDEAPYARHFMQEAMSEYVVLHATYFIKKNTYMNTRVLRTLLIGKQWQQSPQYGNFCGIPYKNYRTNSIIEVFSTVLDLKQQPPFMGKFFDKTGPSSNGRGFTTIRGGYRSFQHSKLKESAKFPWQPIWLWIRAAVITSIHTVLWKCCRKLFRKHPRLECAVSMLLVALKDEFYPVVSCEI